MPRFFPSRLWVLVMAAAVLAMTSAFTPGAGIASLAPEVRQDVAGVATLDRARISAGLSRDDTGQLLVAVALSTATIAAPPAETSADHDTASSSLREMMRRSSHPRAESTQARLFVDEYAAMAGADRFLQELDGADTSDTLSVADVRMLHRLAATYRVARGVAIESAELTWPRPQTLSECGEDPRSARVLNAQEAESAAYDLASRLSNSAHEWIYVRLEPWWRRLACQERLQFAIPALERIEREIELLRLCTPATRVHYGEGIIDRMTGVLRDCDTRRLEGGRWICDTCDLTPAFCAEMIAVLNLLTEEFGRVAPASRSLDFPVDKSLEDLVAARRAEFLRSEATNVRALFDNCGGDE